MTPPLLLASVPAPLQQHAPQTQHPHLSVQPLSAVFAVEEHVEVEATWGVYQRMIAAYREPDRTRARHAMRNLITAISAGVPADLKEIITLGRTLKKRADDVLAYFDRPNTINGPTEAVDVPTRTPPRRARTARVRFIRPAQLLRQ